MQTNYPLEANITPQSAALPSPVSAEYAECESIQPLNLNSGLNESDHKTSEITIPNVNQPDIAPKEVPLPSVTLKGMAQLDSRDSKSQRTDLAASILQWLDPQKIRIGAMPNRALEAYEDESFDALCASMANFGNTQPIQVRTLAAEEGNESGENYLLISGERRLRAAIENGQHVLALIVVQDISADAEVLALTENRCRADLSPFEWGRQLMHVTQQNPAYTLSWLAKLSGRHKSVVSRAIELASLPVEIVQAFSSVRDLRYADAKPLLAAFQKSPDNVIVEAELIKEEAAGLKGPAVVKRLVTAAEGTVAPCNTPESIAIRFEDRVVGALSTTKTGGSQILIHIGISDQQRMELVDHLEKFVRSRVLRASDPSTEKPSKKTRAMAKLANAALTSPHTMPARNDA